MNSGIGELTYQVIRYLVLLEFIELFGLTRGTL
jgi:hypothetical protein